MNQNVFDPVVPRRKTGLWTPWGAQTVPDLDKVLEKKAATPPAKRRPAPLPRNEKAEPALR